jgi:hypothetical protein
MWRGVALALAIEGFVATSAGTAAAAERIALIRPRSDDAVLVDAFNRLQAELRLHDFSPDVVDAEAAADPTEKLEQVAQQTSAVASIAFVHHEPTTAVEIWLVDRVTGKTTMRKLEVGRSSDAASVLAFRAVDLLRISLREYEPGERPPRDVVGVDRRPPSKAVERLTAPPAPRLRVRAEAAGTYDGPLGFAFGPLFGAHAAIGRFELGGLFAGPLIGGKFDAQGGTASTRQELVWLDARFTANVTAGLRVGAGLGAGAHFLRAEGQAKPPLLSRSSSTVGFFAALGVDGEVSLSRAAALGLSLRGFVLAPRQGVAVLSERVELAQPLLQASAGIVVGL